MCVLWLLKYTFRVPNINSSKDPLFSLSSFLYLITLIILKIITFICAMNESCFHSLHFLSSLITVNDSFMENKKQKNKGLKLALSWKVVHDLGINRKFFFLELNIKHLSVLLFRRHFRSQGIFDIFTWCINLFSRQHKDLDSSIVIQCRITWTGMEAGQLLQQPREARGKSGCGGRGWGGIHVLCFYYVPRTVLNASHKLYK